MYFSTNSRYVLHRAPWMTPSTFFMRGAEKFLSVKVPNDDPSKPALRVNIPKESSDSRIKLVHSSSLKNLGTPRSKSLVSQSRTPTFNNSFKDDLQKSESEIQLQQLQAEEFLQEVDTPQTQSAQQDRCVEAKTENDYHEGLRTPLHDAVTEEVLAAGNVSSNQSVTEAKPLYSEEAKPLYSEEAKPLFSEETKPLFSEEAKPSNIEEAKPKVEEPDPRMVYIIVDSPEDSNKLSHKSVAETCKESRKPTPLMQDDFATVKIAPQKIPSATQKQSKPKPLWPRNDNQSFKKSRSLPKLARSEGRQRRFEVREVEDLVTYISHSRQNKDARKTLGVECVPEKEFTTRSGSLNSSDASIKVAGRSFKGLTNEVTPIEELPDFVNIPVTKVKPKARKNDIWGHKQKELISNKNVYYAPAPQSKPPPKTVPREPEYIHSSTEADNGKPVSRFVQDDFGGVRSARDLKAFKMSSAKQEVATSTQGPNNEAAPAPPKVQAEEPERKSDYNLIKGETVSVGTRSPPAESFPPLKQSSADLQDTPQVPYTDYIPFDQHDRFRAKSPEKKFQQPVKKHLRKMASSETTSDTAESPTPNAAKSEKSDSDFTDFQTSGSFVSIGCDKVSSAPMKFSAAFPPLLCEALKIRGRILGFRREFLFSDKWAGRFDSIGQKSSKNKVDLSENSILFPKADAEKFDCSALFGSKEEATSGTFTFHEKEKTPKIGDNIANVANDNLIESKGKASVDSLSMMKKVKEIVGFDLENAIKIFDRMDHPSETPSVMMLDGDKWKVDTEALEMYMNIRSRELTALDDSETVRLAVDILGDKISSTKIQDIPSSAPKYLPPKRESEHQMKLGDRTDSVVSFNPQTNRFFLDKEALSEAMRRRADESFDDVIIQTLEGQLTRGTGNESFVIFDTKDGGVYKMQSGDSILVFDEETQTWKVDYSILEKREEQLRVEEELTKRSELILETFEKLEKNHISRIPKPDSKEKKIFDYSNKEWKTYPQEKKSKEKVSKKLPFKESNAEEIRRNNSDLYENLFVGKKKETTLKKNKSDPSTDKETKSCSSRIIMAAESGSSKQSGTPSDPNKSPGERPKQESKLPPEEPKDDKPCESSKEDSYWESFLKMNILPRDIRDIPQRRPPAPPPVPPPVPVPPPSAPPKSKIPHQTPKTEDPRPSVPPIKIEDPKPLIPPTKIEDPKTEIPPKQIDEPRLRGYFIPFIGDKRIEDAKIKTPPKESTKIEDPKNKPSEPTIGGVIKQDPKIKAPSKESPKIEDPKSKPSDPTIGGIIKQDPKIKAPSKESPKIEDPKKKPSEPTVGGIIKQDPKIKAPSKDLPKVEDPINKPSEPTIGGIIKQDPKIKTPSKESPKIEEPKKKPVPTVETVIKQDSKVKVPAKELPKVEEPKKKPPEGPPTTGSAKPESKTQEPKPKESPKVEDPKTKPPESTPSSGGDAKKAPPASAAHPMVDDPKSTKFPPTIGAPKSHKEKSPSDHYVSDNIVEISRNSLKDAPSKYKPNKIETVKLNITSEKRMPSKVTEINLNKKCEEKGKESNTALKKQEPSEAKKSDVPSKKNEKCSVENKSFYKNFEKYKTPFSDPEYEEKSMKIKSDIESNPNLKKLDNWNKTLVLHDIGKPPENIETWLKDETDKMATLLLKVLQEAADGKPRKRPSTVKFKPGDKSVPKGNPFDGPQKKFETTPENFLFKVRTVNLSLENDRKFAAAEDRKAKPVPKPEAAGQRENMAAKSTRATASSKLSPKEAQQQNSAANAKVESVSICTDIQKTRLPPTEVDSFESLDSAATAKDFPFQGALPMEITDEVPGPEFLKKLSNTWKVFPIIGSQLTIFTLLRVFQLVNLRNSLFAGSSEGKTKVDAFSKLFLKYGPIVNVQGPFSGNVILIHKPEHLSSVFEQESATSVRSVFDSLDQCRRENEEKILSTTVATDWSKPEWNDLRRGSNDMLLRSGDRFFDSVDVAGDSLINSIRKTRNAQNYVSEDFMEEIKRWSLEGLCSVVFEKSFGFLERKNTNMNWIMEPDKLYMALQDATNSLIKCEKGFQTWRLMSTPSSAGLAQAYRSLSTILYKQLYQAELSLKSKNELIKDRNSLISEDLTFLESMLLNDGLTTEDLTCNLVDIMLIGTNMMNSALGFLLYDLSQNLKVQNKLLKELKKALPSKDTRLNYLSLHSLKYLQACLKESLRMHIPVPMFSRMLQNDILLSNYIIPKGTYVVMDYRANCKKEQIFDDPERFLPERWLSDEKWMRNLHPFDSFPLCHGPRADLAKRIVEMQLWACAAKVVRNFGIEYHYGEIEGTNSLISVPDKPLKLSFTERDS